MANISGISLKNIGYISHQDLKEVGKLATGNSKLFGNSVYILQDCVPKISETFIQN